MSELPDFQIAPNRKGTATAPEALKMKLIPLLDRTGSTKAWADRKTGWISNLTGEIFALAAFDGIFGRTGAQVGWWQGHYIQGGYGRVVLHRHGTRIEKLSMPQPKKCPRLPNFQVPSFKPTLRWLLMPPLRARRWADLEPFLDTLGYVQKSAEKLHDIREKVGLCNR